MDIAWLRKAALQGHARAQNRLAEIYERGTGVPKSYKESLKWYGRAASQGDDLAQFNLARLLEASGASEEALLWFHKAGEQGNLLAQAVGPEVLLMDEPTSSLDPKSTEAIEKLVRSLKNSHTILWVTHQHDQAQSIADRVLVLEQGQIRPLSPTAPFVRQERPASFINVLQNTPGYPE